MSRQSFALPRAWRFTGRARCSSALAVVGIFVKLRASACILLPLLLREVAGRWAGDAARRADPVRASARSRRSALGCRARRAAAAVHRSLALADRGAIASSLIAGRHPSAALDSRGSSSSAGVAARSPVSAASGRSWRARREAASLRRTGAPGQLQSDRQSADSSARHADRRQPRQVRADVNTSDRYICNGSSVCSPSLNAVVGVVGGATASTRSNARVEVLPDQRAHLLRLHVVGVVVPGAEDEGADHDPALHLGAEARPACAHSTSSASVAPSARVP